MRLEFEVGETDTMRWATYLTAGGLIAAALLAAVGGFPLDTPMPTHTFGWVEPTCGLTRGSTAIARGDFATAWRYNPLSFLVMGLGVLGVARTATGYAAHRWVNVTIIWSRAGYLALALGLAALWAYQQSNAEFVINARV